MSVRFDLPPQIIATMHNILNADTKHFAVPFDIYRLIEMKCELVHKQIYTKKEKKHFIFVFTSAVSCDSD